MLIASLFAGFHDAAVVIAEDYDILAALQQERVTRRKGDGRKRGGPLFHRETLNEALAVAGASLKDLGGIVLSKSDFPLDCYRRVPPVLRLKSLFHQLQGRGGRLDICRMMQSRGHVDIPRLLDIEKALHEEGFPTGKPWFISNHHHAHALSALFFTDWQHALLYTCDGGGDGLYFSMYALRDGRLETLFGGDRHILENGAWGSVGLAYGYATQALGYRINRHEGKLTGLAAYGKPRLYESLRGRFTVDGNGLVATDFSSNRHMRKEIFKLAEGVSPADMAASMQAVLEDVILSSLRVFLEKNGARRVGLAGGVFANVRLNRLIAEEPAMEEIFVFPAMGDEGLAVGGLYEYLLRRDGLKTWLAKRRRLDGVLWGGAYDDDMARLLATSPEITCVDKNAAAAAARLLAAGEVGAIYHGRMEFGPRALGGRSILASPAEGRVNASLNARLERTEFMPFAPYVLEEDAGEVFEIHHVSRYAMRFMTVTCKVRERWRARLPGIVHVDGTARPQIIGRNHEDGLFARILKNFKAQTGLPVLINTSFNVHEEPIVNRPQEALSALKDGRVDFLVTEGGVWKTKDVRGGRCRPPHPPTGGT